MTLSEITSGESKYLEFKREVPEKSESYMKTVVAFANGSGGKIIFGVNVFHYRWNYFGNLRQLYANDHTDCDAGFY